MLQYLVIVYTVVNTKRKIRAGEIVRREEISTYGEERKREFFWFFAKKIKEKKKSRICRLEPSCVGYALPYSSGS